MDNQRIIELLGRKMAGEISGIELTELEGLMASYPDAAYYEEILKQIWVSPEDETDVSDLYEQHRVKHGLNFDPEEETDIEPAPERKFTRYLIPAFYALFIIFITSVFFFHPANEETIAADTQIISGKGIRKNITLPDGTNVWLNAESKLSYNKSMVNEYQRVVTLSGEAFFDVKHDKEHPFIIKTARISIKVLGTAFDVKAYEGDSRTETTLIKGSVELSLNSRPQEKIMLKPSEKFILNEDAQANDKTGIKGDKIIVEYVSPVTVANKEYLTETSWKENYLVFKNESMEELAPKLERWFNVKIAITDPKIKAYRFTGAFSKETVDQALSAMQLTNYYNFKIKNRDIEIY